jgi:hypothetical protein
MSGETLRKYVIIGVENDGNFTYYDGDKDLGKTDSRTPQEILSSQTTEETKHVKIEVIRSAIEQKDSFKVGNYWYTLVLDKTCKLDPAFRVTKDWFTNVNDYDKIFNIFKPYDAQIDIKISVIENLKFLARLDKSQTTFYKDFPEVEPVPHMSDIGEMQKKLLIPFFAIKSVLDMSRYRIEEETKVKVDNYFINYVGRFGFPNIRGDASHIIASLQMLYDISSRCNNCIKDPKIPTTVLPHIRDRHFYLKDGEQDKQIYDFDNIIKPYKTNTGDAISFLDSVIDKSEVDFFRYETEGTIFTPTTKTIIVEDKLGTYSSKLIGYKEVGRIYRLKSLNHYIYHELKTDMIYDDVSIVPKDNTLLAYKDDTSTISLYVKVGTTYRELLNTKFKINDDDLDDFLNRKWATNLEENDTQNLLPSIDDIDKFRSGIAETDNKIIDDIIVQYLADKSIMDTKIIMSKTFNGSEDRFGVCNFLGYMSFFTAAMQILYDCLPKKSGVVMKYENMEMPIISTGTGVLSSILTTIQNATAAKEPIITQYLFIHQLLNTEYCFKQIFAYINTLTQNGGTKGKQAVKNPWTAMTAKEEPEADLHDIIEPEQIFQNYMKCVYYLTQVASLEANLGVWGVSTFGGNHTYYDPGSFFLNYNYETISNMSIDVHDQAKSQIEGKFSTKLSGYSYPGIMSVIKFVESFTDEKDRQINNQESFYSKFMKEDQQTKQILAETTVGKNVNDFSKVYVPAILRNDCVQLLCKFTNILNNKFDTFMWFEDDVKNKEKYREFCNKLNPGGAEPNFVICVRGLPRRKKDEVVSALMPLPTFIKVGDNETIITLGVTSTPNLDLIFGTYRYTGGNNEYLHTENKNVFLKYDPSNCLIHYKYNGELYGLASINESLENSSGKGWAVRNTNIINDFQAEMNDTNPNLTKQVLKDLTSTSTTSTINIKIEYLDDIYEPEISEDIKNNIQLPSSPIQSYTTFRGKQFHHVGTIYKSIHHKYYYKYYNKISKMAFDDATTTDYNGSKDSFVPPPDMFPFITLYCQDKNIYTTTSSELIYPKTTDWYIANRDRLINQGLIS